MQAAKFHLRPYHEDDFEFTMQLWVETWQHTYPDIDFHQRLEWWKQRWLNELLPTGEVIVSTDDNNLTGFLVFTPATGYLDQLVVSPRYQGKGIGRALLDYAKGRSTGFVELQVNQTNIKALAFYKRESFEIAGVDINERSGMPTYRMQWKGDKSGSQQ